MQYRHITLSDRKVIQKRLDQGKNKKDNKKLFWYVLRKLTSRWSPEQIAMRMRLVFPGEVDMRISHETIYKWVYALKAKSIC